MVPRMPQKANGLNRPDTRNDLPMVRPWHGYNGWCGVKQHLMHALVSILLTTALMAAYTLEAGIAP